MGILNRFLQTGPDSRCVSTYFPTKESQTERSRKQIGFMNVLYIIIIIIIGSSSIITPYARHDYIHEI